MEYATLYKPNGDEVSFDDVGGNKAAYVSQGYTLKEPPEKSDEPEGTLSPDQQAALIAAN